jgi:hypothetical protein
MKRPFRRTRRVRLLLKLILNKYVVMSVDGMILTGSSAGLL